MPNIEIAKLKTRRGTNDQRKRVVFDQGELVSTVDTNRLFIGTGTLSGGVVSGSKIHSPLTNYSSLSNVLGEVGDLVYANNIFYQLTASPPSNINNWMSTAFTNFDSTLFSYNSDNNLVINLSSLSAIHINPITVSNGVKVSNGLIQSDFNTKSLEISSYQLSLKAGGIDERELNSTAFGYGISGGSGTKIVLDVNSSHFYFSGDTLNLVNSTSISAVDNSTLFLSSGIISIKSNGVTEGELNSTAFGYGISGGSGTKIVLDVNPTHFTFSGDTLNLINSTSISAVDNSSLILSAGIISINNNGDAGSYEWPRLVVDTFGRITTAESSILDVLTGNAALSSYNDNNSLSAIYNGDSMGLSSIAITKFTALSSDGTTVITLSSAGFITFQGGTTTRNGTSVGRFAIPIYRY